MELTIQRHCVAQQENGLSPLQQQLLDEAQRVRIVSAPTGAGKTYAFQKALLQGSRILFIVPTRRLAQNIAASIVDDLSKQPGWSPTLATRKVAIWSSDQTIKLREQGVEHIRGLRIRQIDQLDPRKGGESEMIVAVPEVVSQLLHRTYLDAGQSGFSVFDVLDAFDHIVFDEFHTIEARGFGLAGLFAKLVSVTTESGSVGYGRAKVSLLSATPLNIHPTLLALGVADTQIAQLHEVLAEQGRALHGDVQLSLHTLPSMPALVQQYLTVIQEEVAKQHQVVLIYNALADLRRDLPALMQLFKSVDIPPRQVLVINSIDDSANHHHASAGYYSGREQDPDQFAILIATASVEMGVTFRAANLMLMEPGFAPMNFLQRYGRAARKGKDGKVAVRLDQTLTERHPWLRALQTWVSERQGTLASIEALSQVLSQEAQQQFQSDPTNTPTAYFGALPQQAVYTSGLYWQLLMRHASSHSHRKAHLRTHQPDSSRFIYAQLKHMESLLQDTYYQQEGKQWQKLLFAQALSLRAIGKRILVVEGDGRRLQVDRVWLERETAIPASIPLQLDAKDQEYFQLQGELDDYLLDDKKRAQRRMSVYFPHSKRSSELECNASMVSDWIRLLQNRRDPDTDEAWDTHPDAMKAAEQLVRFTGLIPATEVDMSAATVNLVW